MGTIQSAVNSAMGVTAIALGTTGVKDMIQGKKEFKAIERQYDEALSIAARAPNREQATATVNFNYDRVVGGWVNRYGSTSAKDFRSAFNMMEPSPESQAAYESLAKAQEARNNKTRATDNFNAMLKNLDGYSIGAVKEITKMKQEADNEFKSYSAAHKGGF